MKKYPLKESRRRITIRQRSANADFLKHHPNYGISPELFGIIAEEFPSYVVPNADRVEMRLPYGHPDLAKIEKFALSLGLVLEPSRAGISQLEIIDYYVPSASEISSSEYIEAKMLSPVLDHYLKSNGTMDVFSCRKLRGSPNRNFGSQTNLPHLIYIRGAAKTRLESAGLHGITFSLEQTDSTDGQWPDDIEPFYRISSSIVLPSLEMKVFDDKGNIRSAAGIDWDVEKARWYPLDGYEVKTLLRYKYPLPDFDVAISREYLGGIGEYYRRIVYSRKAKEALEQIGPKLEWEWSPVRLIKDE